MKAANTASRPSRLWPAPGHWRPFGPSLMLSVLVLLAAVISAGCVWSVPEPVLVREPRPELVPLRVGVYYSPEFRSFTYRHHLTDTAWVLGEPSLRLLHEALTLLFLEVVEVPRPGSEPGLRGDLAGIIEPGIVSAEAVYISDEPPKAGLVVQPVHVTYGFTVYSPSGESVASWDVTGRGEVPIVDLRDAIAEADITMLMRNFKHAMRAIAGINMLKRNFEYAMREAAWKLTSGFREIPEVREWLAGQAGRKD